MSKSAVYPKAIFADNGISGGTYTSGPPKLVIHTTETSGMPGYSNGLSAPHLTYDPRSRLFVQHRTFKEASRALRNEAGGVQTNRDMALQIELICYSSKPLADQQPYRDWVGDLDKIPGAFQDLTEFVSWVCDDWGIQKTWPEKQALSYTAANKAGFRMTPAEWDSYNGVCGHQHVPENTHWDPGALDWKKLPLEATMTPAQEAKLDRVLVLLDGIPEATREEVMSHPMSEASGFPNFWLAIDRINRNAHELVTAHRTGTLGTLDETAAAAAIVAEMAPGLQAAVAAELKKLNLKAV